MPDLTGIPCSDPARLNRLVGMLMAGEYDMSPQCMKQAPVYAIRETHLVNEGKSEVPRGSEGLIVLNPKRAEQLRRLAPGWR